jgi:tetratricopeptide (TPR) repeat protein
VFVELGPLDPADAARLFTVRATAIDPGFPEDAPEVAQVVARLDHLPLAIELAAARVHVMTLPTLLERLEEPIRTLGGALQRSLAASMDTLPDDQRATLAQCAVFHHPFALEAAEAVVDGVPSVLDALQGLRDRSLVHAVASAGVVRFTVPHTVRGALAPTSDAGLVDRHRAWLAARSAELVAIVDGPRAAAGLAELRALRADLEVASDTDEPPMALVLALDLAAEIDGPPLERVRLLERAADRCADPTARLEIAVRLAEAHRVAGHPLAAREAAEQAVAAAPAGPVRARALAAAAAIAPSHGGELAREGLLHHPDPATSIRLWSAVALDAKRRGDGLEADHALRRALEIVRAAGVARYEAAVTANLANLHRGTGHPAEAERLYRQARTAARALGEVRIEAAALHNLAGLSLDRGAVDEALATTREALAVARHGGEVAVLAHVSHTLGHLLHLEALGAPVARDAILAEAEAAYLEAIGLLRDVDPGFACSAEGDLAALLADRGLPDEAERLLRDVAAGLPDDPGLRAILDVQRAHVEGARARDRCPEEATALRASARARLSRARAEGGARCASVARLAHLALGDG